MVRASAAVENLGLPTVSIICDGFLIQAKLTAVGSGMPDLPIAAYPGTIDHHSLKEIQKNARAVIIDQIISGLTVQPKESKSRTAPEPDKREVVFQGTLHEVNSFFYNNEWSDGLPIIPPTIDTVEEFLKYTDRAADEVIGVLLPDKREATVWNIAVNGVMAGCRPEYMPVLIAIVEVMADPEFGEEHLGHTPGTEVLITMNGPIIKELGFNYEQGALRVGFQANTSIGRFWRLYLRNIAGFLPHKTDKATFGGTWRTVLAENEDAVAKIGWDPLSVDQGFNAGDNVITINSCTSTDSIFSIAEAMEGTDRAVVILSKLAVRIVDVQLYFFILCRLNGRSLRPQILLSPSVAEAIANGGYSKAKMKQFLFEHATFSVDRFEALFPVLGSIRKAVDEGRLPKIYRESIDTNRPVPIVLSPDDFIITVSGDPDRDNCFICAQNEHIGRPISKRIQLPVDWKKKLMKAKTR